MLSQVKFGQQRNPQYLQRRESRKSWRGKGRYRRDKETKWPGRICESKMVEVCSHIIADVNQYPFISLANYLAIMGEHHSHMFYTGIYCTVERTPRRNRKPSTSPRTTTNTKTTTTTTTTQPTTTRRRTFNIPSILSPFRHGMTLQLSSRRIKRHAQAKSPKEYLKDIQ